MDDEIQWLLDGDDLGPDHFEEEFLFGLRRPIRALGRPIWALGCSIRALGRGIRRLQS